MKLKSLLLLLVAIVLGINPCHAKKQEQFSYNYSRAFDEVKQGNLADARDYLELELSDNPNNGLAHLLLTYVEFHSENYTQAMDHVNAALKRLPKKDIENISSAYDYRAQLYAIAGDTVQALADYDRAIKADPTDAQSYFQLGQLLFELERYDEADEAYNQIIKLNPNRPSSYVGLARNAYGRKDYRQAIKLYDKAIDMDSETSQYYAMRAESYLELEDYLNAINDVTTAIEIDNDRRATLDLLLFPPEATNLVVTKLKAKAVKNPNESRWWYLIAKVNEFKNRYPEAIEAYRKCYDIDAESIFPEYIAQCYYEMGDYTSGLNYVEQAMAMDPANIDLILLKSNLLGESGDIDGAIAELGDYIDQAPDISYGYYRRGFYEDKDGRTDAALADYDMSIMLDPDYAYAYLGKGDMLMRKGRTQDAMAAYRKVVELDTVPENSSCAMYAMLALGRKDEAIAYMDGVIESDSTHCGNYYDAACLYSRMGDLDKSLKYLEKAFEKGFRRFHHIMADDDMDALRQSDGFKALYDRYLKQHEQECDNVRFTEIMIVDDEVAEAMEAAKKVHEVPFTPYGGCALVKCTINELPLTFIFDTGASTVSLSQLEANFMLKNGYLKRDDIIGTDSFVDANGDVSEGTIVNLRNVNFGGLTLNNVKASVVRNQKAPLLLGQTVLGRLGRIEIDNAAKKLIITPVK